MTNVEQWQRKHAAEITDAWEMLLRQPWGRQLLFEIIDSPDYCAAEGSTQRSGAEATAYANGMRDAGLAMRAAAQKANPELFMRAVSEAMNERRFLLIAMRADADAAKQQ